MTAPSSALADLADALQAARTDPRGPAPQQRVARKLHTKNWQAQGAV